LNGVNCVFVCFTSVYQFTGYIMLCYVMSSKTGSFGAPIFGGQYPKNLFVVFCCRPIHVMC